MLEWIRQILLLMLTWANPLPVEAVTMQPLPIVSIERPIRGPVQAAGDLVLKLPTKTAVVLKVRRGIASNMGPKYPSWYLALPEGAGRLVKVCGRVTCVTRRSTDAGPDKAMQRKGRVVDLSVRDFEKITGWGWRRGLAPVTVTYLK